MTASIAATSQLFGSRVSLVVSRFERFGFGSGTGETPRIVHRARGQRRLERRRGTRLERASHCAHGRGCGAMASGMLGRGCLEN